ncbi:gp66 [Synechococcus phage syn9]|jgi:hypothetical protein|uniref:Gp66 n=1 Tax=Synechococcus phage syn9 TaxID=382359 RepID=Q0QZG2_BPSYS|nr:gp66 [Synechococcus phage syn9]ABA47035.1 gp66 [Synechococcus phage syn9]
MFDMDDIQWDNNDMIQVEEDAWISDVLGTEDEVINDIVYGK